MALTRGNQLGTLGCDPVDWRWWSNNRQTFHWRETKQMTWYLSRSNEIGKPDVGVACIEIVLARPLSTPHPERTPAVDVVGVLAILLTRDVTVGMMLSQFLD
jgi:hypothetical protein